MTKTTNNNQNQCEKSLFNSEMIKIYQTGLLSHKLIQLIELNEFNNNTNEQTKIIEYAKKLEIKEELELIFNNYDDKEGINTLKKNLTNKIKHLKQKELYFYRATSLNETDKELKNDECVKLYNDCYSYYTKISLDSLKEEDVKKLNDFISSIEDKETKNQLSKELTDVKSLFELTKDKENYDFDIKKIFFKCIEYYDKKRADVLNTTKYGSITVDNKTLYFSNTVNFSGERNINFFLDTGAPIPKLSKNAIDTESEVLTLRTLNNEIENFSTLTINLQDNAIKSGVFIAREEDKDLSGFREHQKEFIERTQSVESGVIGHKSPTGGGKSFTCAATDLSTVDCSRISDNNAELLTEEDVKNMRIADYSKDKEKYENILKKTEEQLESAKTGLFQLLGNLVITTPPPITDATKDAIALRFFILQLATRNDIIRGAQQECYNILQKIENFQKKLNNKEINLTELESIEENIKKLTKSIQPDVIQEQLKAKIERYDDRSYKDKDKDNDNKNGMCNLTLDIAKANILKTLKNKKSPLTKDEIRKIEKEMEKIEKMKGIKSKKPSESKGFLGLFNKSSTKENENINSEEAENEAFLEKLNKIIKENTLQNIENFNKEQKPNSSLEVLAGFGINTEIVNKTMEEHRIKEAFSEKGFKIGSSVLFNFFYNSKGHSFIESLIDWKNVKQSKPYKEELENKKKQLETESKKTNISAKDKENRIREINRAIKKLEKNPQIDDKITQFNFIKAKVSIKTDNRNKDEEISLTEIIACFTQRNPYEECQPGLAYDNFFDEQNNHKLINTKAQRDKITFVDELLKNYPTKKDKIELFNTWIEAIPSDIINSQNKKELLQQLITIYQVQEETMMTDESGKKISRERQLVHVNTQETTLDVTQDLNAFCKTEVPDNCSLKINDNTKKDLRSIEKKIYFKTLKKQLKKVGYSIEGAFEKTKDGIAVALDEFDSLMNTKKGCLMLFRMCFSGNEQNKVILTSATGFDKLKILMDECFFNIIPDGENITKEELKTRIMKKLKALNQETTGNEIEITKKEMEKFENVLISYLNSKFENTTSFNKDNWSIDKIFPHIESKNSNSHFLANYNFTLKRDDEPSKSERTKILDYIASVYTPKAEREFKEDGKQHMPSKASPVQSLNSLEINNIFNSLPKERDLDFSEFESLFLQNLQKDRGIKQFMSANKAIDAAKRTMHHIYSMYKKAENNKMTEQNLKYALYQYNIHTSSMLLMMDDRSQENSIEQLNAFLEATITSKNTFTRRENRNSDDNVTRFYNYTAIKEKYTMQDGEECDAYITKCKTKAENSFKELSSINEELKKDTKTSITNCDENFSGHITPLIQTISQSKEIKAIYDALDKEHNDAKKAFEVCTTIDKQAFIFLQLSEISNQTFGEIKDFIDNIDLTLKVTTNVNRNDIDMNIVKYHLITINDFLDKLDSGLNLQDTIQKLTIEYDRIKEVFGEKSEEAKNLNDTIENIKKVQYEIDMIKAKCKQDIEDNNIQTVGKRLKTFLAEFQGIRKLFGTTSKLLDINSSKHKKNIKDRIDSNNRVHETLIEFQNDLFTEAKSSANTPDKEVQNIIKVQNKWTTSIGTLYSHFNKNMPIKSKLLTEVDEIFDKQFKTAISSSKIKQEASEIFLKKIEQKKKKAGLEDIKHIVESSFNWIESIPSSQKKLIDTLKNFMQNGIPDIKEPANGGLCAILLQRKYSILCTTVLKQLVEQNQNNKNQNDKDKEFNSFCSELNCSTSLYNFLEKKKYKPDDIEKIINNAIVELEKDDIEKTFITKQNKLNHAYSNGEITAINTEVEPRGINTSNLNGVFLLTKKEISEDKKAQLVGRIGRSSGNNSLHTNLPVTTNKIKDMINLNQSRKGKEEMQSK